MGRYRNIIEFKLDEAISHRRKVEGKLDNVKEQKDIVVNVKEGVDKFAKVDKGSLPTFVTLDTEDYNEVVENLSGRVKTLERRILNAQILKNDLMSKFNNASSGMKHSVFCEKFKEVLDKNPRTRGFKVEFINEVYISSERGNCTPYEKDDEPKAYLEVTQENLKKVIGKIKTEKFWSSNGLSVYSMPTIKINTGLGVFHVRPLECRSMMSVDEIKKDPSKLFAEKNAARHDYGKYVAYHQDNNGYGSRSGLATKGVLEEYVKNSKNISSMVYGSRYYEEDRKLIDDALCGTMIGLYVEKENKNIKPTEVNLKRKFALGIQKVEASFEKEK